MFNHFTFDGMSNLGDSPLDDYVEAGIDPAFDRECEEWELLFAERCLNFNHD